jgi:type VI secretion system secreted protein VgrG
MAQAVTVSGPLKPGTLVFQSMKGREELGRLFEFTVQLLSEDEKIKLDDVIGKNLTLSVEFTDQRKRVFNGQVVQFRQLTDTVDNYFTYEAILRPHLWFLTRTSDCKIFPKKSAPDIIKDVLKDNGITDVKWSLSGTYSPREYCVQYNETDFDFISRLMEEEGIYYFFTHEKDKHTVVMADDTGAHKDIEGEATIPFMHQKKGYAKDLIYEWNLVHRVQPGVFAHTDYDFTKPKADLKSQSKIKRTHDKAEMELFNYEPGTYDKTSDGEAVAKKRIEEEQVDWETVEGATNCPMFACGSLFTMKSFHRADQNDKKHLLTATDYEMRMETSTASGAGEGKLDSKVGVFFDCHFEAVDSKRPFRSECITEYPVVPGPQTAVVVGKSGEEIWTDEYGRIKVQFFWDRLGKKDENSSCWLRVAQSWSGKGWGIINIPRIGEEVIVEFIDGDPDQPIVTGRVYNADQKVPYTLPDSATQSGIKTHSSKDGDDKTFNELRFEDKNGEEEVYFHAEKNFNRVVENNDTLKVGYDKKDPGDQTIEIYNNRTVTIEKGNDSLDVKEKDRSVTIDKGNDSLTITQGNLTIKVSAGKGSIETAQELLLKVGESTIKITPSSIEMTSVNIKQTANGQLEANGAQVKVAGSGMVDIDGGVITMN